MNRAASIVDSSVAYIEVGPDGGYRLGLDGSPTLQSLALLAARANETAHELEVTAVRQQLGIGVLPDAFDVACEPLASSVGAVVLPFSASVGLARPAAPRRSTTAVVIPFRRIVAQAGDRGPLTPVADVLLVELAFTGRRPAVLSMRANGDLDARMKLRAADALRVLAATLLKHEVRYRAPATTGKSALRGARGQ